MIEQERDVPESAPPHAADPGRAILDTHRAVWSRKPSLRRIYESYFRTILSHCTPQRPIVELGAGPGFLKAYCPEIIATDISPTPWIDAVVDGCHLPFQNGTVGNIVMMDVFHHIARPQQFLEEAARVLALGGRIVMLEPWTSPLGYLFYRHIHHEGADRTVNPQRPFSNEKAAFDGNAALPRMYFDQAPGKDHDAFSEHQLRLVSRRSMPAISWLLTGGFRPYSLLPSIGVPLARGMDAMLAPLARWCALRAIVVLERTTSDITTRSLTGTPALTPSQAVTPPHPPRPSEEKRV